MEYFFAYVIIAAILSSAATFDFAHPLIAQRAMPTDIRVLYYIVFFLVTMLVAPVVIPIMLSKEAGTKFRNRLDTVLFEQ